MKQPLFRARHPAGLTLLELIVTVVILAIIAGVAIPLYRRTIQQSTTREAIVNLDAIRKAQFAHYAAHGTFADALDLLAFNPELDIPISERHFDYAVAQADDQGFLVIASAREAGEGGPVRVSIDEAGRVNIQQPGSVEGATGAAGAAAPGSSGGGGIGGGSGGSGTGSTGGGGGGSGGSAGGTTTIIVDSGGIGDLSAITGLSVIGNNGSVAIGWDRPFGGVLGAAIFRATSIDGPFVQIAAVAEGALTNYVADFGVTNDTTYYYQARPVLSDGSLGTATAAISVTPSATSAAALKANDTLDVLLATPSTGQAPFLENIGTYLQTLGLPIGFSPGVSADVLGFFQPSINAIFLNALYINKTANVLAETLAHEGTHAWFHNNSADAENATLATHPSLSLSDLHISVAPGDSIDQEYHAFMAGFHLWAQVDDGTDANLTSVANDFLTMDEETIKTIYVRPAYAPQGLPEF